MANGAADLLVGGSVKPSTTNVSTSTKVSTGTGVKIQAVSDYKMENAKKLEKVSLEPSKELYNFQAVYGVKPYEPIGGIIQPTNDPVYVGPQIMYGVVQRPIDDISRPINDPVYVGPQIMYGVVQQPIDRTPVGGDRQIRISYDQMKQYSQDLKSSANEMRENWNNISKNILGKLSGSWGGSECEAYVSKIKNMDSKIENSFKALELLGDTYNKVVNEASNTQDSVRRMIDSL